jgi:hypothetical protein
MDEITYTRYVKTDGAGAVTNALTSAFVKDPENWQEAGEQSQRHWHLDIINEYGTYKYELSNGEVIERTAQAIETDDISNLKTRIITDIKQKAQEIILNQYPYWKQNNYQSEAIRLLEKKVDSGLTTEEEQTRADILAVDDWINGIRSQSDFMETELEGKSLIELMEYVINYNV